MYNSEICDVQPYPYFSLWINFIECDFVNTGRCLEKEKHLPGSCGQITFVIILVKNNP